MAYTEEQKRQHIRELQTYLHGLAHVQQLPHISVDGVYGPETSHAVRAFQEQHSLRPTGQTDSATWNAIIHAQLTGVSIPTITVSIFPPGITDYTLGDAGTAVFLIQTLLQAIQSQFFNMPTVEQNGIYDADTQKAITQFQQFTHLAPSGNTDPNTWNHLIAALAKDLDHRWNV